MNTIKLYKGTKTWLVKLSVRYRFRETRRLPYVSEVEAWAAENGWTRKKPRPAPPRPAPKSAGSGSLEPTDGT